MKKNQNLFSLFLCLTDNKSIADFFVELLMNINLR
jgi:hypothetical protein